MIGDPTEEQDIPYIFKKRRMVKMGKKNAIPA